MSYIIKKLDSNNARDLSRIVTLAWNQTYKNIVDKEFLDYLKETEDYRIKYYVNEIDDESKQTYLLEVDGKYVGFIKIKKSSFEEYSDIGEIESLYLINGYKGYGYGRILFDYGINELKKLNYNNMIVGCLVGNKSNYFYIYMGGKQIGDRKLHFGDKDYIENIYLFDLSVK